MEMVYFHAASNTPMPGSTTLTTQNGSSISSRTFEQLRHKVPMGYNGTPHIPVGRFSSPSTCLIIGSMPTYHPKRHLDPISPFSTIHRTVRHTDCQIVYALLIIVSDLVRHYLICAVSTCVFAVLNQFCYGCCCYFLQVRLLQPLPPHQHVCACRPSDRPTSPSLPRA